MSSAPIVLVVAILLFFILVTTNLSYTGYFSAAKVPVLSGIIKVLQPPAKPQIGYVPDELLVSFSAGVPSSVQQSVLGANGARVKEEIPEIGVKVISVSSGNVNAVERALSRNPNVEFVERNSIYAPQIVPNDPEFSKQWHHMKIETPQAWIINRGSSNVLIAVLDTGFDPNHPDLIGKFAGGYNVIDGSSDWSPAPCGHGTMVAGVAAALTNNDVGISGTVWENKILPIKITGSNCLSSSYAIAKGITYASQRGARVASISFGIYGGDRTITKAARYMYNRGGLVVAAGGNSGSFVSGSDNKFIVSISSTEPDDTISSFSTSGNYIDFAAPGSRIYTTCNCITTVANATGTYTYNSDYIYASGTSFATPIVAATAALVFSASPTSTPQQVYDILKNSASDLGSSGRDVSYGWGRINAYNALQLVSVAVV